MKKSRFTEQQIAFALRQAENGTPVSEVNHKIFLYGFYFRIQSAFHIVWRDLNVGSWIDRIQPREYTLKATGGVRVVSDVQSFISIY